MASAFIISKSDISIHQQGGVKASDLPAIRDSVVNEKAKAYPEATMWGNLPAKGFYLRHTRDVHFDGVEVQTEAPDALIGHVFDDIVPDDVSAVVEVVPRAEHAAVFGVDHLTVGVVIFHHDVLASAVEGRKNV